MSGRVSRHYAFPPFHFDLNRRWLIRDGERVALSRLPSRLLLCLIGNAGRVVTYEDIVEALWNRRVDAATFDDKRNVHQHISAIRGALNDPLESSRFIVSEPGIGYWFREDALTGTPEAFPAPVSLAAVPSPARDGGANDSGMRDILARLGVDVPDRIRRLLGEAIQLMARKGNAAPEVKEKLTEAMALCAQTDQLRFFIALQGLCLHLIMQGQLQAAYSIGSTLSELAESLPSAYEKTAHDTFGVVLCFLGECRKGLGLLELGPAPDDQGAAMPMVSFTDPRVSRLCYMAHAFYALGYPEQACRLMDQALELADGIFDARSLVFCCQFGAALYQLLRKPEIVRTWATRAIQSGKGWPFQPWPASGMTLKGWALAKQGDADHGIGLMEQGIQDWEASRAKIILPRLYTLLAEAYGGVGRIEEGLQALDTALAIMADTGDRHYAAETYRMRGVLLLRQRTQSATDEAETAFREALRIARQQQAKAFELRAAVSLGRLRQAQGRHREARRLLAELYGGFSEGFDTPDLQEAKALLVETSQEALAVLGDEELVLYMLSLDRDFQAKDIANALGSASAVVTLALDEIEKKINPYF